MRLATPVGRVLKRALPIGNQAGVGSKFRCLSVNATHVDSVEAGFQFPHVHEGTIQDIMGQARPAVSINVESNLLEACKLMTEEKASTLLVEKDGGIVAGLLTERDILQFDDLSSKVGEFMTSDVTYASPTSLFSDSFRLLNQSQQDHLPILKQALPSGNEVKVSDVSIVDVNAILSAKQLIGQFYFDIVGKRDLTPEERAQLEMEAHTVLKLPSVKNIIRTKKTNTEDEGELGSMVLNTLIEDQITVAQTLCQMKKFEKGSVAVLDILRDVPVLVGIATERDIIRRALSTGKDLDTTLIADIMTSAKHGSLATVTTKDTLLACAYKMIEKNVRHLPVVSPKGEKIYGMVSSKDVISYICESMDKQ